MREFSCFLVGQIKSDPKRLSGGRDWVSTIGIERSLASGISNMETTRNQENGSMNMNMSGWWFGWSLWNERITFKPCAFRLVKKA